MAHDQDAASEIDVGPAQPYGFAATYPVAAISSNSGRTDRRRLVQEAPSSAGSHGWTRGRGAEGSSTSRPGCMGSADAAWRSRGRFGGGVDAPDAGRSPVPPSGCGSASLLDVARSEFADPDGRRRHEHPSMCSRYPRRGEAQPVAMLPASHASRNCATSGARRVPRALPDRIDRSASACSASALVSKPDRLSGALPV